MKTGLAKHAGLELVLLFATGLFALAGEKEFTTEEKSWWAVQPVRDPVVPVDGVNPVDAFIGKRLVEVGLEEAPVASPEEFIRRAFFDLHGLPPSIAQIEAFVAEWSEDADSAVEALIDDLLASPRYGERWAQHWLDVVRYAETDGYREDKFRPGAYRYRDYVIRALNEDRPYDEFVREQLAADDYAADDPERLIATAFLRHGVYEWNQRDAEMQQEIITNEMTRVTGEVFLALGIGCAQCHDHKFDPILQRDYFALKAFFSSTCWPDDRMYGAAPVIAEWKRKQEEWEEKTAELRAELDELVKGPREKRVNDRVESFPKNVQAMYLKPSNERTASEQQIAMLVQKQIDREVSQSGLPDEVKEKGTPERKKYKRLLEALKPFESLKPAPLPGIFIATDTGSAPAPVFMGSGSEMVEVRPGVLSLLEERLPDATPTAGTTGRRRLLAEWIVKRENPFTSRVIVNRIWQYHFGRGLVATPNDFGTLGEPPTHPDLLDWMASRFVEGGWKMKPLHRMLMTSATYRQTARREPGEREALTDPSNRYLWRFPPRRLSAEQVRDAMLVVSGEMKERGAGPSVNGNVPNRSVYVKKIRNTPDPMIQCLDSPAGFESAPQRQITTTPIQSLFLTNNAWPLDRAGAFARRVAGERESVERSSIEKAYKLAWGRDPGDDEVDAAFKFLNARVEGWNDDEPESKYEGETGLRPIAQRFGKASGIVLGNHALWLQPGSPFENLEIPAPSLDPSAFTIEAVLSLESIHPDSRVNIIASQWSGDQARIGWTFSVTSAFSAIQPRNLVVQLVGPNPGGDIEYETVGSGLRVPLNTPVYVAAVINCRPGGKGSVRFYVKDLAGTEELQVSDKAHNISGNVVSPGTPLIIGERGDRKGRDFDGQIARLRVQSGDIGESGLLVNAEPADPPVEDGDYLFSPSEDELPAAGGKWTGVEDTSLPDSGGPVIDAFTDFCHALLSSNEFLYLH